MEKGNFHDVYAVSVMKDSVVVGHLPRKISPVTSLLLMKDGTILCKVLGRRGQRLEDASIERWRARVSKGLEYFQSFKF